MTTESPSMLARLRQPVAIGQKPHQLVGGVPQVSLLPGEVREAGAVAKHRRRLIAVVVLAAVVAGGGVAMAQEVATSAKEKLASAQAQAQALNGQLAKFNDLLALESRIAVGKAAVKVGSSTMIDWNAQIEAIEADMPSTYAVTDISANGATPFAAYEQGDTSLEPTRVATIVVTATTSSIGNEFSTWLLRLKSIPAYADVTATTDVDPGTGGYVVTLTMHLNPKAISAGSWTTAK